MAPERATASPADGSSHPWLSIVGIGEDGLDGLSPAARVLVSAAEILIGGDRHLSMIPDDGRIRIPWPSPLAALVDRIEAYRNRAVCILATGDPMQFGIGTTLSRRIPAAEMIVIPGVSAFALASARMGWAAETVETLTLHGRPVALLGAVIWPGQRILALSHDAETPAAAAEYLSARGYGDSEITMLSHMGGVRERRISARAADWSAIHVEGDADLNTLAIVCRADPGTIPLPRLAGLPDAVFEHDGKMTKREIRAATLAKLAPGNGAVLWDVGAGSGSVAIEWMRADRRGRAVAVEPIAARSAAIARNATALGTPLIDIRCAAAPEVYPELPDPDAIFLGGGLSNPGVFTGAWARLKTGGRLVANAVTLESEAALLVLWQSHGGELVRLSVNRAEPVGPYHGWRPLMPVTQWHAVKP